MDVRSVNAAISMSYSFYPLLHFAATNSTCNQSLIWSEDTPSHYVSILDVSAWQLLGDAAVLL
jgi:hypothetical protein